MSVLGWRNNFSFFFFFLLWECSRFALLANFRLQALGIVHDSYHAWDSLELICHGTEALPLRSASPISPTLCSTLSFSEFEEKLQCFTDSSGIMENHLVNFKSHWKGPGLSQELHECLPWFLCHLVNWSCFLSSSLMHILLLSPTERRSCSSCPLEEKEFSCEAYTVLSSKSFVKQRENALLRKDESRLAGNQK